MKKFGAGKSDKWEAFSHVIVSPDCSALIHLAKRILVKESKRNDLDYHDPMVPATMGTQQRNVCCKLSKKDSQAGRH
jgi:UDP-glucose 4-epimerase